MKVLVIIAFGVIGMVGSAALLIHFAPERKPHFHQLPDEAPDRGPVNRYLILDDPATRQQIEAIARIGFASLRADYPTIEGIRLYIYASDSLANAGWGEWVAMMSQDRIVHPEPTIEFSAQRSAAAWPEKAP